ncbi:MAG: hypothetical protein HY297_02505 [Thaumarchaeota archaeon]|nr:hypothetical protein [Nitrososphaerota archaeon]
MPFLRVVEVFPPVFPADSSGHARIDLESTVDGFVNGVRGIRDISDLVLVANLKKPDLLRLPAVQAASILQDRAGVKAAPVIVARDSNRPQLLSQILEALSLGLNSMMLAWGDRYPPGSGIFNAYDFHSLSAVISEAVELRRRTRKKVRILSPVDLARLSSRKGEMLADSRLAAGADLLLAQPPTTDSRETFGAHSRLLEKTRLKGKVLLNVFPFRSRSDAEERAKDFGWNLPPSFYTIAKSGERALLDEARKVAQRLRDEGFPGVYLATRGDPSVAEKVLG